MKQPLFFFKVAELTNELENIKKEMKINNDNMSKMSSHSKYVQRTYFIKL